DRLLEASLKTKLIIVSKAVTCPLKIPITGVISLLLESLLNLRRTSPWRSFYNSTFTYVKCLRLDLSANLYMDSSFSRRTYSIGFMIGRDRTYARSLTSESHQ
ncbi:Bgt-50893, partial [Blumeria graminis f. sp. tritici]